MAGPNAEGWGDAWSGGFNDVLWLGDERENSEIRCHHHLHQPSLRPKTSPPTFSGGAWQGGNNRPFTPATPLGAARLQALGTDLLLGSLRLRGATAHLLGQWGDSTNSGPVLLLATGLCSAEGKKKN